MDSVSLNRSMWKVFKVETNIYKKHHMFQKEFNVSLIGTRYSSET